MKKRRLRDLGEAEVERVRTLNLKLKETQAWATVQAARCLADYEQAGGRRREWGNDDWDVDAEVEVVVRCILREDHPDHDDDEDNIVAELTGFWDGERNRFWPAGKNWNPYRFYPRDDTDHDHYCWLFHELSWHALDNDWDKVLSVGRIWVDVRFIPQRRIRLEWSGKPGTDSRTIDGFSEEDIERLRALNLKLEEAAAWVNEQATRFWADYVRAGGRWRERGDADWEFDAECEAEVRCLIRRDHPDYGKDEDGAIASIWAEISDSKNPRESGLQDENWNEFRHISGHRLAHEHHCWLFHDLTDHTLHRDWGKVLSIGSLWVDAIFILQRQICWWST